MTESPCVGNSRLAETKQPIDEPEIIKTGSTMLASADAERQRNSPVVLEDPAHISDNGYKQSIADFLAKPMLVSTVTLNTSSILNTLLWSGSILNLLKSNPIWTNKLSGSSQIKATAVVTIQVNASPYNAGALLLHFLPNSTHNAASHTNRRTLIQKSQQPGMRIDIAEKKEISMEIPYVGPTEYCDLTTMNYDWGEVFLTVWSDFTTGSSAPTSCAVTIWLSFIDVDIRNPIVPQGAVKNGQRGRVKPFDREPPMPSEQEKGPVSKILSAVSVMAATVSSIPTLAPIAGPVSWFTNVAAGVASAFGWSKPVNDDFGSRMIEGTHFGMPNCSGIDHSQPLSLFPDNKVRVMSDLGGDGLDHMSINYLKSVPTYFDNFDLNYSDTVGHKKTVVLAPKDFVLGRSIGTVGGNSVWAIAPTPVCFLSRLFQLWRGSLVLRFHVHKTQFHTGRLMIAFSPINQAAPTIANSAYLHRAIIDLALTNEICLTFPYLHNVDYLEWDGVLGACYIYVLNPLRGPDAVSSRVQVTMEVFGGPDLEFQVPRVNCDVPILAQMGDATTTAPVICENIGASSADVNVSGASQYSVGECVTSLLQLLKRYTFCKNLSASYPREGTAIRFYPFATPAYIYAAGSLAVPTIGCDYMTMFSSMYAYSRGGVRYRTAMSDSQQIMLSWLVPSTSKGVTVHTSGLTTTASGNVGVFCHKFSSGGASFQVPQYGRTYCRLNHQATPVGGYGPDSPNLNLVLSSTGASGTSPSDYYTFRAAADDFQLAYFIGIPDIYVP